MVAAIRQTLTVQADGRIETRSPQLRPGATAEVIVLVESLPSSALVPPTPAQSLAALEQLQRSLGLDRSRAEAWVRQVAEERAASPRAAAPVRGPFPRE